MSKHTPWPWEWVLGEEWGYSALWNPETCQEVITTGGRNDGDYPVTWMGEEMSEADAQLIAAAPDLLEALKQCCTDLMITADNARDASKTDPRWEGVAEKLMARVDKGRAAIAKAEVSDNAPR